LSIYMVPVGPVSFPPPTQKSWGGAPPASLRGRGMTKEPINKDRQGKKKPETQGNRSTTPKQVEGGAPPPTATLGEGDIHRARKYVGRGLRFLPLVDTGIPLISRTWCPWYLMPPTLCVWGGRGDTGNNQHMDKANKPLLVGGRMRLRVESPLGTARAPSPPPCPVPGPWADVPCEEPVGLPFDVDQEHGVVLWDVCGQRGGGKRWWG